MVRTRRTGPGSRTTSTIGPLAGQPPLPILDKDLTHYQSGLRWSFSNGQILLEGSDVNQLLAADRNNISTWLGVAAGVDEYRKRVLSEARERDQFTRFQAVTEALLAKIFGHLHKIYDETTSGLSTSIENGQLILNGINVRSFLNLYRLRRTEKAGKFLKGLREKLKRLLNDPSQGKIHRLVQELCEELDREVSAEEAAGSGRALSSRDPVGS